MKDPKKNAFTFIFMTILIYVIGLGIIIPVLEKFIGSLIYVDLSLSLGEVLYTNDNNDK